jgi:hypothetical protein
LTLTPNPPLLLLDNNRLARIIMPARAPVVNLPLEPVGIGTGIGKRIKMHTPSSFFSYPSAHS